MSHQFSGKGKRISLSNGIFCLARTTAKGKIHPKRKREVFLAGTETPKLVVT